MRLSVLSTSQSNLSIVDGWTRLIGDVPICCRAHYRQTSNLLVSIQVLEKIERLYTPTGVLRLLNLVIEISSLNDQDRRIRNFGQASCEEYQNCSSIQKEKEKGKRLTCNDASCCTTAYERISSGYSKACLQVQGIPAHDIVIDQVLLC